MNRFTLALLTLVVLLAGCSKKAAYTPDRIEGRLDYSVRTPAPIIASQARQGATLAGGSLLTASAEHERLDLPEDFKLVGLNGPWRLVADQSGALEVIHASEETRHRLRFDQPVLAATTDGEVVATLCRDNTLRLHNLQSGTTDLLIRERQSSAVAAPVATPLIGADQVIFATLDGKIVVVDRAANEVVLERVVGTGEQFGNVRFLAGLDGRIIAATADRVISLAQDGTSESLSIQVRHMSQLPSGLYLFTTEGDAIALSSDLERLYETRLPFARIIAAAEKEERLYLVERSGYLIKTDPRFLEQSVYELPDLLAGPLLVTPEYLYLHRKGIRWP